MTTITVVGAGLAGLACSLGLARQGYYVDLVERRANWDRKGSAFGLAPNGIRALDEVCNEAMDELRKKGIYLEQTGGYMYGWWMVRDALLEQVNRNPNITLHRGYELQSFDDESDTECIKAKFCKTDTAELTEDYMLILRGSLLVAADGVYSTVRKLLDLPPALSTGKIFWRGALDIPKGSVLDKYLDQGIVPLRASESLDVLAFSRGSAVLTLYNFHPAIERRMSFSFTTEGRDCLAQDSHPREVFDDCFQEPEQQDILQEVYRLADNSDLHYPLNLSVIKMPDDLERGWGGKGRVALVGDAAHALRPASGLGGSMAFEDAAVLCRSLRTSSDFSSRESIESLIESFEHVRLERVKKIWDNQWELSEKTYSKEAKIQGWDQEFKQWVYQGV